MWRRLNAITESGSSVPDQQLAKRRGLMKKQVPERAAAPKVLEMRPEYDFSGGVRGKHAQRYAKGTNIVFLDPDVAEVFPNSAAVNEALRALLPIVGRRKRATRREKRSA